MFITKKMQFKTVCYGIPSINLQKQIVSDILEIFPNKNNILFIGGKDYNGSLTQAKCAITSSPLAANGGLEQYGRNSLHFCVGPDSQDDVNASVSNSKLSIEN